ncbi:MAG: hypothetical protein RMA76_42875 [Deltaproteobacteria bacterium]
MVDIDRTKDVELLRQVAKIQETENERLRARIVALSKQVDTLTGGGDEVLLEQIALLEKELQEARRGTNSNGSERRPTKKDKKKEPKKKSKSGRTAQPDLAVQPVHHQLEVEGFQCKACGGGLEEWKGHYQEADENRHRRRSVRDQTPPPAQVSLPMRRVHSHLAWAAEARTARALRHRLHDLHRGGPLSAPRHSIGRCSG